MVRVAFVCTENARRSQMAEALCRLLAPGFIEPYSAGTDPVAAVDPLVVEVLSEVGADVDALRPKALAELPDDLDYVVTMGCGVECPLVPARALVSWEIEDPKGKPVEEYRRVRDTIEAQVRELVERILSETID